MFSTVSNWLAGAKSNDAESEATGVASKAENDNLNTNSSEENSEVKQDSKDLHDVSTKAVHTAKEWGSYLLNYGKVASAQVAKAAVQLKEVVADGTLLGDFSKEQEKFAAEKRQKQKMTDAAVPPWVGYNEEEAMKKQILALSKEKRNFLRNPPAGVQFSFDYSAAYPVALTVLQEDANLQQMRFELVPKQVVVSCLVYSVTEEQFWRNYFYRVSLIKQSAQLSAMAQQTEVASVSVPVSSTTIVPAERDEAPQSPVEHEFVSDTFAETRLSSDEIRQLQTTDKSSTPPAATGTQDPETKDDDWEAALQHELQEFEVVMGGQGGAQADTDADLENELLRQIEEEQRAADADLTSA